MSESAIWDAMREKMGKMDGLHMLRVENVVGDGTPDVSYCYKGVEGWIELKFRADTPKRDTTPVFPDGKGLRFSQKLWLAERAAAGGRCWIMSKVGKGWFLHHGSWAFSFNMMTLDDLEQTATWFIKPKPTMPRASTDLPRLMREVLGNRGVGLVLPKGAAFANT